MPDLFKIVEEAKKILDDGHLTLNECFDIMKFFKETTNFQSNAISKTMKVAEELLYDAKCQVAIGDEDPKEANPMFSIKAFREHMKAKKEL